MYDTKEIKTMDWIKEFKSDVKGKYYVFDSNEYIISDVFDIEITSYSNTSCILKCGIKCHCVWNFDDEKIIPNVVYGVTLNGIIEIK